mgnify:CR=1 FL=1
MIQRFLETLYDVDLFGFGRDIRSKPYRHAWKENAHGLSIPGLTPSESLLLTSAQQQLSIPSNRWN